MTRAVTLEEISTSTGIPTWRLEPIILEEIERGHVEQVGSGYTLTELFLGAYAPAIRELPPLSGGTR